MKWFEKFKDYLYEKYVVNNFFNIMGKIPETNEQKYWFNKGLEHSVKEIKQFNSIDEIVEEIWQRLQ